MPVVTPKVEVAAKSAKAPLATTKITKALVTSTSTSTESIVREYFKDIPKLAEVARCESHFRQNDSFGKTFRGVVNVLDVGVMQINEYYHKDTAFKLGFDIYSVEGNMAYGRYLYEKEGLDPWNSSSPCWSKKVSEIETKHELASR